MEIEFTTPEVTVVEREGPAEFCVERTGDIRSEVDITVSTDNITDGRPRAEGKRATFIMHELCILPLK